MIVETYRGVKIRVRAGRKQDWGYIFVTVNGHDMGRRMEHDAAKVLQWLRATVDEAIKRPDAYETCWQPGHKGVRDTTRWQNHRCA